MLGSGMEGGDKKSYGVASLLPPHNLSFQGSHLLPIGLQPKELPTEDVTNSRDLITHPRGQVPITPFPQLPRDQSH